jgi:hypothetical protein
MGPIIVYLIDILMLSVKDSAERRNYRSDSASNMDTAAKDVAAAVASPLPSTSSSLKDKSFRLRLREILWDTLDSSPEERRFVSKIDFFILTWAGFSYFSKNLNSNNLCAFGRGRYGRYYNVLSLTDLYS